ncbi:hypothetical protein, partial [Leptonema illini]|uniref:hypothetical protein n=1 Tax=Leptonema illini TaxID=183 RepID=UPI0015C309A5
VIDDGNIAGIQHDHVAADIFSQPSSNAKGLTTGFQNDGLAFFQPFFKGSEPLIICFPGKPLDSFARNPDCFKGSFAQIDSDYRFVRIHTPSPLFIRSNEGAGRA